MTTTYREPAKVIADILTAVIAPILPDGVGMTCAMSNQKYDIPTDGILFVFSYISGKAIGTTDEASFSGSAIETQSATMHDMVQIDMMSFDNTARIMRGPVLMALNSIISQQLQEKYAMRIGKIPTQWNDASDLEETKMLTRYVMTVQTTSVQRITANLGDYFDTFPTTQEVVNP